MQNPRNQSGYVPSNYVKKEKPSIFDSIKKKVKKGGSFSKTLPSSAGGSPVREFDSPLPVRHPQPFVTSHHSSGGGGGSAAQHDLNTQSHLSGLNNAEAQGWALVRYNYNAQQQDELSLIKGTKVLVLEKSSDGWWRGQYENQIGWFPSNYTLPDSLQQQQQQQSSSSQHQPSAINSMSNSQATSAASAMVMSAGEHMYSAAENVLDVVVALYRY